MSDTSRGPATTMGQRWPVAPRPVRVYQGWMIRAAVWLVAAGLVVGLAVGLGGCATSYGTAEHDVVFSRYSPLSRNLEIARRALPPLTFRRIAQTLAARHEQLAEQAIDLAREKYDIYVPPGPPPPEGYGLIVFIAPWAEPTRPQIWRAALDRHRMIFVAAQRSGNEANILDRRVPLALLGYANVYARYPINDQRVYLWGFSGGSRTAEIVELAYPDIFRGVVLNAGADPIDGREGMYKPPAELFRAFQRARLVYITGDQDSDNLRQDDVSQASMREACVFDIEIEPGRGLGHQTIDGVLLDRVLDALEAPRAVDEARLAACNARVEREIAARVEQVAATIDRGDLDAARKQILAIDARFGGVAADALLQLDDRLAAQGQAQGAQR